MKHTPGPWTDDKWGGLRGANGEQVFVWGLGIGHGPRSEQSEANSTLMKAAPELLDVLRSIVDSLPQRRDWLDPVIEAIAKDAIAKAEGAA